MSLYISLNLFWKCLWTLCWKILENVFENCLTIFKTFSKKFQNNLEWLKKSKIDRWGTRHWNSPLRERLSLEAPSDNREKKKRNVFILHCEKISTFSSRAKHAHGREAPRKTQTRGSERSTENPTGAEFWPKSVPSGRRVLIFVILGRLSKEEIERFSICFSNF